MEKWIEKNGTQYKVDGEFYIAEDESHVIYREVIYKLRNGYYKRARNFSKDNPCNLHRAVWIDHFGPVPPGHHIHHKDSNRKNNHIENLQCLDAFTHLSRSAKKNLWLKSQKNKDHLNAIRKKAIVWQKSEEGRKWHSESMGRSWKNRAKTQVVCQECGKEFLASFPSRAKYCHKNCLERARKRSGVENENRPCVICKKYFVINKFCRTRTCCRICADEFKRRNKLAKSNQEMSVDVA